MTDKNKMNILSGFPQKISLLLKSIKFSSREEKMMKNLTEQMVIVSFFQKKLS